MSEIKIVPVNSDTLISKVAQLAKKIWFDHYSSIIDEGQIEYMVNRYQSKKAIREQIDKENYQYFITEYDGETAGYFGIQKKEGAIFLSKLYVDKIFRKKGIARYVTEFLRKIGERDHMEKIWLTVNRNNKGSVAAYEKLGFTNARSQIADIGEGYVMDDYIMELFL